MKRLSTAILALILALSAASTAFALGELPYADVSKSDPCAEAVLELYDAGIMEGSGGMFRPDSTITRQEFAAVICRLLDEEENAQAITASVFTDVPDTEWSVGYIARAAELKIVNGYGGGRFGPKDPVTVEQAAKMLVCAWGYEDAAIAAGGWPSGYMSVARDIGILTGVTEAGAAPAKRSVVAMMAYQTLMNPTAYEEGGCTE